MDSHVYLLGHDHHLPSALSRVLLQAGRWQLALHTLDDMRASGVEPNVHNWGTAIDA